MRPARQELTGQGDGTLWLLRHGPVDARWRGRLYGHSDAELAPGALEGLRWIGPAPDQVVCSDLSRTVQTARALFPDQPLHHDPRLREASYGNYEGRLHSEIHQEDPEVWDRWLAEPDRFRFPGGESFDEVMQRVVPAMEEARLRAPDGQVVVVAHSGSIRSYIAWLLEAGAHGIGRLRLDPLSAAAVRFISGVPVLQSVNRVWVRAEDR